MPEPQPTRGWWLIWAYTVAHNLWAVNRNREMLSEAARRTRQNHPILTPVLGVGLFAHLMGWLNERADPLAWVGGIYAKVRRR